MFLDVLQIISTCGNIFWIISETFFSKKICETHRRYKNKSVKFSPTGRHPRFGSKRNDVMNPVIFVEGFSEPKVISTIPKQNQLFNTSGPSKLMILEMSRSLIFLACCLLSRTEYSFNVDAHLNLSSVVFSNIRYGLMVF